MATLSPQAIQKEFFSRFPLAESIIRLFDSLPHAYFYAKDRESRFMRVNQLFLENHGFSNELEVIGKTDRDLHPPVMAEAYREEDRRVMESGQTIPGQVWLVLHRRTTPRWYISTKTPLFTACGEVIGIAGAMYRIEQQAELEDFFKELMPVVRHIDANFSDTISMTEMSSLAGLSSTHFNRRFRQLLRMTPLGYLRTVRIQAAQQLLTTSSQPIADIAAATGFNDQSHLTRRFRETTGMTPAAYRRRFVRP